MNANSIKTIREVRAEKATEAALRVLDHVVLLLAAWHFAGWWGVALAWSVLGIVTERLKALRA